MKHLVLAGAGHAHLATLHAASELRRRGIQLTVVDPEETLRYSGMAPARVGGRVADRALSIPVADIVRRGGAEFIRARVTGIDAGARRVEFEGGALSFDALSCAIGSVVVPTMTIAPDAPDPIGVKPVGGLISGAADTMALLDRAPSGSRSIAVVGGGPSGIELAGALLRRGVAVTLVTSGSQPARRLDPRVGEIAADNLRRRGAEIHFNSPVERIDGTGVTLATGGHIPAARVFLATGLSTGGLFTGSGLPVAPDGSLLVDEYLRVPGEPIFAGGDCVAITGHNLQRAGVHAVRQGPILRDNLVATLEGDLAGLKRYSPPSDPFLIINLGDETAICVRGDRVHHGRWCAALKLRIDWAFIRSGGRRTIPSLLGPPRRVL